MIGPTNPSTGDALDMLEDVSARARAMNLGLVVYPVADVEAVCAALRGIRSRDRVAMVQLGPLDPPADAAP